MVESGVPLDDVTRIWAGGWGTPLLDKLGDVVAPRALLGLGGVVAGIRGDVVRLGPSRSGEKLFGGRFK